MHSASSDHVSVARYLLYWTADSSQHSATLYVLAVPSDLSAGLIRVYQVDSFLRNAMSGFYEKMNFLIQQKGVVLWQFDDIWQRCAHHLSSEQRRQVLPTYTRLSVDFGRLEQGQRVLTQAVRLISLPCRAYQDP